MLQRLRKVGNRYDCEGTVGQELVPEYIPLGLGPKLMKNGFGEEQRVHFLGSSLELFSKRVKVLTSFEEPEHVQHLYFDASINHIFLP